jgi:hypothetical protein
MTAGPRGEPPLAGIRVLDLSRVPAGLREQDAID